MRIRNKEWHKTIFEEQKHLIVDEPKLNKGQWHKLLSCKKLHVEIGAGKGDYWLKMSQLYPEDGFVAIEKDLKVAAILLKKSKEYPLDKSLFIALDAVSISEWFNESEIDYLHLNFSDPWPKKSHHKRRLTTKQFIKDYYTLLNNESELWIKSDNREFFEYSIEQLSQNGFNCIGISLDYRKEIHDQDVITEYEQRFIDEGKPIYRSCWRKRTSLLSKE